MSEQMDNFHRAQDAYDRRKLPELSDFDAADYLRFKMDDEELVNICKTDETYNAESKLLYLIAIGATDTLIKEASESYRESVLLDVEREYNT